MGKNKTTNIEEQEQEIEQTEELTEENFEDEPKEPESIEDSIKEAIKEAQAENLRNKGEENEVLAEEEVVAPTDPLNKTETDKLTDQEQELALGTSDYEVPSRLDPTERELFSKLPKKFKPAVSRMFKEHQTELRRAQNELAAERREAARERQEAAHVIQAIRPYYTSNPDLAKNGITEAHLVTALIGAHQKLTKPETKVKEYLDLGREIGIDVSALEGLEDNSTRPQADILSLPAIKPLQEEVSRISSMLEKQRIDAAAAPVIAEFQTVKNEKDPVTGRFLYPQLQNDAFWGFAKSLILQKINAGQKPADAVKSAYVEILGPVSAPLNSSNQVSLPAKNQNNNRAVSAAVSVRGKVAPQAATPNVTGDVPKNETIEQSIMAAIEETRRGI